MANKICSTRDSCSVFDLCSLFSETELLSLNQLFEVYLTGIGGCPCHPLIKVKYCDPLFREDLLTPVLCRD